MQEALLAGMRNAAIADDKLRLRLLDKYESLHALMICLQSTMETGKLAREQLELIEKRSAWQKVRDALG